MVSAEETLASIIPEIIDPSTYDKGVYIWDFGFFFDMFGQMILRAGIFFYIQVNSVMAEFKVDCQPLVVGPGDMLFIAPRMTIEFVSKSRDLHSCCLCMEPIYFDSLSTGSYVYKRL